MLSKHKQIKKELTSAEAKAAAAESALHQCPISLSGPATEIHIVPPRDGAARWSDGVPRGSVAT